MINKGLISPKSIAVVGGSNHLNKPGGKLVKNILDGQYSGSLYVVNPKDTVVQGIPVYPSVDQLPPTDLAILAIPALACIGTINQLLEQGTKAFIIISAGFGEAGEEGKKLELELANKINAANACLIGPNCIGVLNPHYHGVFTSPIPKLHKDGCDLISSSGGVATFLMEAGIVNGLRFSSVFSVGNAAQTGIEEVLEYMDNNYVHGDSAPIKLLYLETVKNPDKLFKHASSLIRKGAKIAGIKAGSTEAGSRAAASHTGAIANSDMAVRALFRKAGIVFCTSREELITVASIFNNKDLLGKNIAVITHAGGNAVMLSDSLSKSGMSVPVIEGPDANKLMQFLHPGSSVSNPIDFLATGTAEQLGIIIDYCEHKFNQIDAMVVVFGSAGLLDVENVYNVLGVKMDVCSKPIYPVLPSIINAQKEIAGFLAKGYVNFPDEVILGKALGAIFHTPPPVHITDEGKYDAEIFRKIVSSEPKGFLSPEKTYELLKAAKIPVAKQVVVTDTLTCLEQGRSLGYPLAAKVIGPLHKSDVQGVLLNIRNSLSLEDSFNQLMSIPDAQGVLLQPMHTGHELFIGAHLEQGLGHLIVFGLGGIYIELFKDVQAGLVPLREEEIRLQLKKLKSYPLMLGVRGKSGINIDAFIEVIIKVSRLIEQLPEIVELDINPLMGNTSEIIAVDARIHINRKT